MKRHILALVGLSTALLAGAANAGVHVGIGIGLPGVVIGGPPVYYAPPPPAYYAPPPVYVRPAPVYYAPPPAYYYEAPRGYHRHRGHGPGPRHWRHEHRRGHR
jgi:hypothetical protein